MRALDWTATPLGDPQGWPAPLRALTCVLLGSQEPALLIWGRARTMLYNDAYAALPGARPPHSTAGAFPEGPTGIPAALSPLVSRAFAGIPVRERQVEVALPGESFGRIGLTVSCTPVRDEAGDVAGVYCTCGRPPTLAEQRLRFLLEIGDSLRSLFEPRAIVAMAIEALGRHLGVTHVAYGEMNATGEFATVQHDWTADVVGHGPRPCTLRDFAPILRNSHPGEVVRLRGSLGPAGIPRAPLEADAASYAGLGVPLVKSGRFAALLYVHDALPRRWSDEDEALVRNVAERVWDALERARAESSLRELHDRLEREIEERTAERDRLWELSEDLLLLADYDGHLLRVSPSWSRLLGYAEATLLATPYTAMTHPHDLEPTTSRIEEMRRTGRPVRVENRIRGVDGTYRWIAWTLSPDPGGLLFHGVGRDVQEERLAVEELAAANRQLVLQIEERERVEATLRQMQRLEAIGQLTSGVAHDFNNLLTVVLGNITPLKRIVKDESAARRLDMMHAAAERGAKLTGQLLAFSRNLRLEPKPLDLNETVAGMRDLIQSTMGGTVTVETVLQPGLWSALVDPTQIELVILNLAINARDAMSEGGTLTVATCNATLETTPARQEEPAPGDYVVVSVSDTGTGMSEEVLAKAFEPFFTTKEVGKGSGLGLSQVLGIAQQSGGGVRVSTRVGAGTTVELYLPRAVPPVVAPARDGARAPASAPEGPRPTVLLVDDESGVREVAAFMLDELGYAVVEAGSGGAALELLDREPRIDVLLVDFAMPGMNGAELAREARAKRPRLPVVFITGYADFSALRDVPPDRIVQKPLHEDELGGKLRAALEAAGAPGESI